MFTKRPTQTAASSTPTPCKCLVWIVQHNHFDNHSRNAHDLTLNFHLDSASSASFELGLYCAQSRIFNYPLHYPSFVAQRLCLWV